MNGAGGEVPEAALDPTTVDRLFELQARHNIFELIIETIYRAVLRDGDLTVDAGAHMGVHTWPMAEMVGRAGRVVAVEAIPAFATELAEEARKRGFDQVSVAACAVAEESGQTTFHWVKNAPGYSGIRERDYDGRDVEIDIISVDKRRLADLLADAGQPWRFAKLDLEGGEFHALKGAKPAILAHRPLLVFENGRAAMAGRYGYSAEEWFAFFAGIDYRLYDLFGRTFDASLWNAPRIPWYSIAAPRDSKFQSVVEAKLPAIIRAMVRSFDEPAAVG